MSQNNAGDTMKKMNDKAKEVLEVLDVTAKDGSKDIEHLMKDVKKYSPPTQVAIGAGAGWLTGYTAIKVGKAAAVTVLCAGLAVKMASDRGYISVNRSAVERTVNDLQNQASALVSSKKQTCADMVRNQITKIYHNYKYLTIGFSGGLAVAILF